MIYLGTKDAVEIISQDVNANNLLIVNVNIKVSSAENLRKNYTNKKIYNIKI